MNEREIAELRRSLRKDRITSTCIKGCYFNAEGRIVATFERSFGLMGENETEKYLSVFRRALSGVHRKNLIDLAFSNGEVEKGEEQALLRRLRASALSDAEALNGFYQKVAAGVKTEDCCVLLLLYNEHDVPFVRSDGEKKETRFELFSFVQCVLCPVRSGKAALIYDPKEKTFLPSPNGGAICPPRAGFVYPAFDDRSANIYGALYYTSDEKNSKEDFALSALGLTGLPAPAYLERQSFRETLAEGLGEDCSFEIVKNLHCAIAEKIAEHKESRDPEPLSLDKSDVKAMLADCGADEKRIEDFARKFNENLGATAELAPKNIDPAGKLDVRTPEVTIKVAKGAEHLIRREEIGGKPCLVIDASGGVEVNGLAVK